MTVDIESAAFAEAVGQARKAEPLIVGPTTYRAVNVSRIPGADQLPRALVELLENCVRRADTDAKAVESAKRIVEAGLSGSQGAEIAFMPARVLFQDFTGVPVFVDFAAMRDAMAARGGDPAVVSPRIPCTLVVDHSVIADEAGCPEAADRNLAAEARRNRERFAFLKWSAESFDNVRIVPPGQGICHQLNMERISEVVTRDALDAGETPMACFDTLVGTDSHTTTANGLGVMGWGVGGIEAEAAALGQPISMLVPPVVELRLTGRLRNGVSGMDLALTVCERMRAEGVVGSLIEVTGEGVRTLTATQRACVANMTPEYGATTTLFPVDERSLEYLRLTGRDEGQLELVERYLTLQGTFGETEGRVYARTVEIDLSEVGWSLAGPSRPHRRVEVADLPGRFEDEAKQHGHEPGESFTVRLGGEDFELEQGAIAIAAITSCTTATDPAMMAAAGILARKAVARGLEPKPWVKKILAPGSHAASLLLRRAGLEEPLAQLGFYTCGFGCMSCIGNSGPLAAAMQEAGGAQELTSVLSGNRNFDGRISPYVAQNYLCQPALVVAYSIAGTVDIDLTTQPVGIGSDGVPVMLSELMPTDAEIAETLAAALTPDIYSEGTAGLFDGPSAWRDIAVEPSSTFAWDPDSTYVRCPSYFEDARKAASIDIRGARVLALLGDFVTTDHISPAGSIAPDSEAAAYLRARGVGEAGFNTYGSRRGNHEVMMRGTFANVKLENALGAGRLGAWTTDFSTGDIASIFAVSEEYRRQGVPAVVLAGKMYGSGSSRDWAAKGPALLGVRAVLAESFERIHRWNLVQMGIVPLQFDEGEGAAVLGLDGTETYDIAHIDLASVAAGDRRVAVCAKRPDGSEVRFACTARIDTPTEAAYMESGGILPYVLDELC